MNISKKELSIIVEILFSILFAFIYMPFFYENSINPHSDLVRKTIEIVIFVIIYFSIAYSLLEIVFKKTEAKDERDDMINSKSYKLGYLLYEIGLFVFIGTLLNNLSFQNNGSIIFLTLMLIIFISFVKSSYQLYLHRTL